MAGLELLQEDISAPDVVARKRNMLVSVVIPTYNRAELVERAVRSVLSQTYPHLEAIVVDDASTDDTRDRVEAIRDVDSRVRYIKHETNRGAQAARNLGIQAAHGSFIGFLDSDDEWLPEKLSKQLAQFTGNSTRPGVVYCGFRRVLASGESLGEYIPQHRGRVYQAALQDWLADTNSLVVRREILELIGGLDETVNAYQEWDLCIRLARVCEFDFVSECLTLYHQHALPSISKDHLRDAYGYLGVIDNHYEEILCECGRRTLSEHYLSIGRLFVLADQFDLARAYFLKSIRCYPIKIKAMMHYGVLLLGNDVYRFLRALKHG